MGAGTSNVGRPIIGQGNCSLQAARPAPNFWRNCHSGGNHPSASQYEHLFSVGMSKHEERERTHTYPSGQDAQKKPSVRTPWGQRLTFHWHCVGCGQIQRVTMGDIAWDLGNKAV